jgi:D-alanine-D-alanine ligase
MAQKIRVGVIFGGKSAEHEVSVRSARNIIAALDKTKYEAVLVGIDREGRWHLGNEGRLMLAPGQPTVDAISDKDNVMLAPAVKSGSGSVVTAGSAAPLANLDVVFPVLHGPNGEDGTMQGLLKLAGIPFVGPSVLGSAVGMDKDVMKRLMRDAGIPIGRFEVLHARDRSSWSPEALLKSLGSPVFVKPANMGSSVGIRKASTAQELQSAVDFAFLFDRKVIIEAFIKGREIECAVLGNDTPKASLPGEIIAGHQHDFYSYEAKYVDCEGQRIEIPAKLPKGVAEEIQALAVKVFQVLCCEGMSRVDFFYTEDGRILVNEINTIPGFTNISMYPMMWKASGVEYSELIGKLIELALERHKAESALVVAPASA